MNRRRFITTACLAGSEALLAHKAAGALPLPPPRLENVDSARSYGLLECADGEIFAAFHGSRTGILKCTVNDKTHCPDAGQLWGLVSVLNDLYFGLYGEGVLGLEPDADRLLFRPAIPEEILPVRCLLRYRGADIDIAWVRHRQSWAELDGAALPLDAGGFYALDLARPSKPSYRLEIGVAA